MSLQRQHFLLSYLKTLSVGPAGVWTRDLPLGRPALACENIRFSTLFAAKDVSRETSPAAKSEEKRMFSQARPALSQLS